MIISPRTRFLAGAPFPPALIPQLLSRYPRDLEYLLRNPALGAAAALYINSGTDPYSFSFLAGTSDPAVAGRLLDVIISALDSPLSPFSGRFVDDLADRYLPQLTYAPFRLLDAWHLCEADQLRVASAPLTPDLAGFILMSSVFTDAAKALAAPRASSLDALTWLTVARLPADQLFDLLEVALADLSGDPALLDVLPVLVAQPSLRPLALVSDDPVLVAAACWTNLPPELQAGAIDLAADFAPSSDFHPLFGLISQPSLDPDLRASARALGPLQGLSSARSAMLPAVDLDPRSCDSAGITRLLGHYAPLLVLNAHPNSLLAAGVLLDLIDNPNLSDVQVRDLVDRLTVAPRSLRHAAVLSLVPLAPRLSAHHRVSRALGGATTRDLPAFDADLHTYLDPVAPTPSVSTYVGPPPLDPTSAPEPTPDELAMIPIGNVIDAQRDWRVDCYVASRLGDATSSASADAWHTYLALLDSTPQASFAELLSAALSLVAEPVLAP